MIDLHMHTIYSDGTDEVKEILKKANDLNIEVISITDHNSVKAYLEMENNPKLRSLFKGNIINGCEFTTSYKSQLIEVLGYGIDYKIIDKYLEKYYSVDGINYYSNTMYNRIVDKLLSLGYTFNLPKVKDRKFNTEFFNGEIFNELMKYEENIISLKKEHLTTFSAFFRKGITNPKSKFFVDSSDLKPSLKEIIDIIHKAGGKSFLAHPYQYAVEDMHSFLSELTSNYNIDGIECYHTTFSKKESDTLVEYAKNNNLCISGGSDYHGRNKINHDLARGNGNLNISKDILKDWKI